MSEVYFCANGGNQSSQVWVSLRGNTKMAESKMEEFKLAEFKMAAIITVESEWMSEDFLCKMAESKIAKFKMTAITKLNENEWVKFYLCKCWGGNCEWSFFCANGVNQSWQVWVNLRGKTKMAESNMAKFKMAELKKAAIIRLSENELVKSFLCKMAESKIAKFKMTAITKLNENEWVKFYLCKCWGGNCEWSFFCANGVNQSWQVWVNLRGKTKMAESNMAKFKMAELKKAAIIRLSENELVKSFLRKMAESKMAQFKKEDFKIAPIIKLIRLN